MKVLSVLNSEKTITPTKIICVGRNYVKHIEELENEKPVKPLLFLKPPSALIGNEETIILPPQSKEVHHEVELAVIIGKRGKQIIEEEALDHVFGYAAFIDVTARDIQQQAKEKGYPWTVSKGFDTFAPISEVIPKEQISDPQNIELSLSVNEELRQQGNTSHMIFSIPYLISYASSIFTLEEGDIIATGTPEGVGVLQVGDELIAKLDNVLELQTKVMNSN